VPRLGAYAAINVALMALAVVTMLAIVQRRMIYPIGYGHRPAPNSAIFTPVRIGTPSGNLLVWRSPGRPGLPILLFLHGNATDVSGDELVTLPFRQAGWTVVVPEYPGYPGNPGSPSQAGLLDAARAGWRLAGSTPSDVVILGNSIGSGAAIALAAETHPRGLAVVSGIASLPQVVRNRFPMVPDALIWDRYYNVAAMRRVTAPVLIVHGRDDDLVPLSQGLALAAAARVKAVVIPGGHDVVGDLAVQSLVLRRFDAPFDAQGSTGR
jgi:hypothetical protein